MLPVAVLRHIEADYGIDYALRRRECGLRVLTEDEFHAQGIADRGAVRWAE